MEVALYFGRLAMDSKRSFFHIDIFVFVSLEGPQVECSFWPQTLLSSYALKGYDTSLAECSPSVILASAPLTFCLFNSAVNVCHGYMMLTDP
ncbi:hypothetical protein Mapa_014387 [Marchantia paleacea]|nr:hypothetical protein Mapa_014387 [Marchantia paleacea]